MDNPTHVHIPADMNFPGVEPTLTLEGKGENKGIGHSNSVESVTVHPVKAGVVASGSHDHLVKVWDVNAKKCI